MERVAHPIVGFDLQSFIETVETLCGTFYDTFAVEVWDIIGMSFGDAYDYLFGDGWAWLEIIGDLADFVFGDVTIASFCFTLIPLLVVCLAVVSLLLDVIL